MAAEKKPGQVFGTIRRPSSVIGDDDSGRSTGWIDPPSFCAGSTPEEIERAFKGDESVYVFDLARQKDSKNPIQCETKRLVDLRSGKLYREGVDSIVKNFVAGVVNSVVPGGDLGDASSSARMVGNLAGGVAGSFVNPTGIISKLENMSGFGRFVGNAINFANKTFSGPVGSIVGQGVLGLINNPSVNPVAIATTFTQPRQAITAEKLTPAQTAVFGKMTNQSLGFKASGGGVSVSTGGSEWYKNPFVIIAAVAAVIFAGYKLLKK